jgi:hypothetical protein
MHERVHLLGRELVGLFSLGRHTDAQMRLEDLHRQRDELIAGLRGLISGSETR